MDGKRVRLLKLVNMAENGTPEEKRTAVKKIELYMKRYGFTRKDIRTEKPNIFNRMCGKDTYGKLLEYASNQEKARIITAFIEDNDLSIQTCLSNYNHTGLVQMVNQWLKEKESN